MPISMPSRWPVLGRQRLGQPGRAVVDGVVVGGADDVDAAGGEGVEDAGRRPERELLVAPARPPVPRIEHGRLQVGDRQVGVAQHGGERPDEVRPGRSPAGRRATPAALTSPTKASVIGAGVGSGHGGADAARARRRRRLGPDHRYGGDRTVGRARHCHRRRATAPSRKVTSTRATTTIRRIGGRRARVPGVRPDMGGTVPTRHASRRWHLSGGADASVSSSESGRRPGLLGAGVGVSARSVGVTAGGRLPRVPARSSSSQSNQQARSSSSLRAS